MLLFDLIIDGQIIELPTFQYSAVHAAAVEQQYFVQTLGVLTGLNSAVEFAEVYMLAVDRKIQVSCGVVLVVSAVHR